MSRRNTSSAPPADEPHSEEDTPVRRRRRSSTTSTSLTPPPPSAGSVGSVGVAGVAGAPEPANDDDLVDSDASMSEEESEASEYSSSESEEEEEEDCLFDFVLSETGSKRSLLKGDLTDSFGIDVAVESAKQGAEIRKKNDSLRIIGKKFTLKLSAQEEDDGESIAAAFESISKPVEPSSEAKLLAFLLVASSSSSSRERE